MKLFNPYYLTMFDILRLFKCSLWRKSIRANQKYPYSYFCFVFFVFVKYVYAFIYHAINKKKMKHTNQNSFIFNTHYQTYTYRYQIYFYPNSPFRNDIQNNIQDFHTFIISKLCFSYAKKNIQNQIICKSYYYQIIL